MGWLWRLFEHCLNPGGRVFLIHFDALSEEQEISLSVRRLKYPFFVPGRQSPSKMILDKILASLIRARKLDVQSKRYSGDAIKYDSIDEALEVFFNFHMECEFNDRRDIVDLVAAVRARLEQVMSLKGELAATPGCYIYKIHRK